MPRVTLVSNCELIENELSGIAIFFGMGLPLIWINISKIHKMLAD